MPQIVVEAAKSSGSANELFLLEFQGKFETRDETGLSGKQVGQLQWEGTKPVFVVGNQRLLGREINLPKPLAILKQLRKSEEISVLCVMKKKILFDSRPITVMK